MRLCFPRISFVHVRPRGTTFLCLNKSYSVLPLCWLPFSQCPCCESGYSSPHRLHSTMAVRRTQKARRSPPFTEFRTHNPQISSSANMSAIETQMQPLAIVAGVEATVAIQSSENNRRRSILMPLSGSSGQDVATPRTLRKTKDDIRYYFRPTPKEDIRIYFRPMSKSLTDRSRTPRARAVTSPGKPKVRSRRVSPNGRASPLPGPEVPPKAKERTSGQKNRDIFLPKQRETKSNSQPARTNQNGSTALPGFNPDLAAHSTVPPTTPLSPRITEVVDSSLMPSPLRNKTDVAAESAPEYDDRTDKERYCAPLPSQPITEYQEHQSAPPSQKPDSIYGTLPPLPVHVRRNNSQPNPHSPRLVRHRRQDTPYSPNDVGRDSALDDSELRGQEAATSDAVGRSSSYASSDVLPTPVALEEWASEQRRIAHGQPAIVRREASTTAVTTDNKDKDKGLKKTKSTETRLFRSRKGKAEKKEKEKLATKEKTEQSHSAYRHQAPPPVPQESHHPGTRWDVATLPPSPEMVRPPITSISSDMTNNPSSIDSMSDKIVVMAPQLTRAQTDQGSIATTTVAKAKKPNKLLKMLESYSNTVSGMQMVQ